MDIALITGSAGLIGSEAVEYFIQKEMTVVGLDNDMRKTFFGDEASTAWNRDRLKEAYPEYRHEQVDVRDHEAVKKVFEQYGNDIKLIIHTAAQPSHDWAAKEPLTDFTVNAYGTLLLLELTRLCCPQAVFIFASTNKVYGDNPNRLPFVEQATRWEIEVGHPYYDGIDEEMSVDQCKHSLFGCSKLAADVLVQEYGQYFELKTACFRGGCLTGPKHSGTQLHGFLAYLMKCCATGETYTLIGYQGKQVRDNIHSRDLVLAFDQFYEKPRIGEVYNMGGGRENNCSVLEAIEISEQISGKKIHREYIEDERKGDHIWYISGLGKFKKHYPSWSQSYTIEETMREIHEYNREKWDKEAGKE